MTGGPIVTLPSTISPAKQTNQILREYAQRVNNANITYRPIATNSNAFAHQGIEYLWLPRPQPPVSAPGSDTVLWDPRTGPILPDPFAA